MSNTSEAKWIDTKCSKGDRVRFIDQKDGVTVREGVIAYEQFASFFGSMFYTVRCDNGYRYQLLIGSTLVPSGCRSNA